MALIAGAVEVGDLIADGVDVISGLEKGSAISAASGVSSTGSSIVQGIKAAGSAVAVGATSLGGVDASHIILEHYFPPSEPKVDVNIGNIRPTPPVPDVQKINFTPTKQTNLGGPIASRISQNGGNSTEVFNIKNSNPVPGSTYSLAPGINTTNYTKTNKQSYFPY